MQSLVVKFLRGNKPYYQLFVKIFYRFEIKKSYSTLLTFAFSGHLYFYKHPTNDLAK